MNESGDINHHEYAAFFHGSENRKLTMGIIVVVERNGLGKVGF